MFTPRQTTPFSTEFVNLIQRRNGHSETMPRRVFLGHGMTTWVSRFPQPLPLLGKQRDSIFPIRAKLPNIAQSP